MAGDRRVLIPGGTGYVGGRVAEHLNSSGWRVRVASRSARTWPGPAGDAIEVQACDWRDAGSRARALDGCEAVLMLAAANEIDAAKDPVAAADATSTQCLAWLQGAVATGVRRMAYASTIHVYGPGMSGPIGEDAPTLPQHPYAESHLAAEVFVRAARRRGDLSTTVFRLSNAFGAPVDPRVERWSLLVNDLARQAVRSRQLALRSDGLQARDFVPMRSVCEAFGWALESDAPGELYNLGSGKSLTVLEMAQRVAGRCEALFGWRPPILRPEPSAGAVPMRFDLDVGAVARDGGLVPADWDAEIDALLRFCARHFATPAS